MSLLALILGGALGANARYGLTRLLTRLPGSAAFPTPTLCVNVLGSLILGAVLAANPTYADTAYLFLGVGFCGAFTTFSTFATETHALHRTHGPARAALYIALTITLCPLATTLTLLGCAP